MDKWAQTQGGPAQQDPVTSDGYPSFTLAGQKDHSRFFKGRSTFQDQYENKIQDYFKMTLAEIQTIMQKLRNLAKTRPVNAESKARKLFTELN